MKNIKKIKQVSVYRNLHKPGMFSIRQSGKVIGWSTTILLEGNIAFHVNENGRLKVTRERKKKCSFVDQVGQS